MGISCCLRICICVYVHRFTNADTAIEMDMTMSAGPKYPEPISRTLDERW